LSKSQNIYTKNIENEAIVKVFGSEGGGGKKKSEK
jgi:hypothetical protein